MNSAPSDEHWKKKTTTVFVSEYPWNTPFHCQVFLQEPEKVLLQEVLNFPTACSCIHIIKALSQFWLEKRTTTPKIWSKLTKTISLTTDYQEHAIVMQGWSHKSSVLGSLVRFCSKLPIWVCAYRFQFFPWQSFPFFCCPFSFSLVDERNWRATGSTRGFHGLAGNGDGRPCQGLRALQVLGVVPTLCLGPAPVALMGPSSALCASFASAPRVSSQSESLLSALFCPLLLSYSSTCLQVEASLKDNSGGFIIYIDRNHWHEPCLYRAAGVQMKQENLNPPVELD